MGITVGVGFLTLAACVAVQSSALVFVVRAVLVSARRECIGRGFWRGVAVLEVAVLVLVGFVPQANPGMGLAVRPCGESTAFEHAFYRSAVNHTTLGYGDVVMSKRWRLLGPLEAVNGVLMGGLAAAEFFFRTDPARRTATEPGLKVTKLILQASVRHANGPSK